jgi:hypothetical protein
MELYPWSFDSIHSHCHPDVILIVNILKYFKEFGLYRLLRTSAMQKNETRAL